MIEVIVFTPFVAAILFGVWYLAVPMERKWCAIMREREKIMWYNKSFRHHCYMCPKDKEK